MITFESRSFATFATLDPIRAEVINQLIIKLQRELRITSIVVTHDLGSAFQVADVMVMFYEGGVVLEGTPGPPFQRVIRRLAFSARKSHFTYFAVNADGKRHLVINGRLSDPYDDVYPVVHFDKGEKNVAFCTRTGQEIWWRVMAVK